MLVKKQIKLRSISDAKDLVEFTARCSGEVDLSYDRILIDAKSILGILGLDLRRVLTISFSAEDQDILSPVLNRFVTT